MLAGCNFFSNPGPTASGLGTSEPSASAAPSPTPTPTPVPRSVGSIVLVAAIGESGAGTPSAVAWQGIQEAGGNLGAAVSLVNPLTRAELAAAVAAAAERGTAVVVTVGSGAFQAVMDAAAAHPATQFLVLDQAIADDAPANVRGLIFDESEAGYLAGVVAAGVTESKKVGFVGDLQTDASSASYAGGFRNGSAEIDPSIEAEIAYAGRQDDTQRGRTAAAGLVKDGADVVVAMAGISGDGALRGACDRKAKVIALETDATLMLPDISGCLVVSVVKRYDVAIRDAVLGYAAGGDVPRVTMNDVASGGIALTEFHAPVPPALKDRLATVLAVLESGPPRPTPTPVPTPTPAESPAESPAA